RKAGARGDGVSSPEGMAGTSSRREARASRIASHVYTRSPMSTPAAVPGTMRWRTRSGGNLKTPMRRLERMTSCVVLSRASPKNALTSPGASQRGPRRPAVTLGGSLPACRRQVANEPSDAVGEGLTPGQAAAPVPHVRVCQVELRGGPLADPDAQPIGRALARAFAIEQHGRVEVLPLGVCFGEVPEPAPHVVVVTPAEHVPLPFCSARRLAFVEASRQTLLAPFFVHERRLTTLLAQIAHPTALRRSRLRRFRGGVPARAHVLAQCARPP